MIIIEIYSLRTKSDLKFQCTEINIIMSLSHLFSDNLERELKHCSLNCVTNLWSVGTILNLLKVFKNRILSKIMALTVIQLINKVNNKNMNYLKICNAYLGLVRNFQLHCHFISRGLGIKPLFVELLSEILPFFFINFSTSDAL